MPRRFSKQAGHRVKRILQAISCVEATVGSTAGHASVGGAVSAYDENVDGQVEGKSGSVVSSVVLTCVNVSKANDWGAMSRMSTRVLLRRTK